MAKYTQTIYDILDTYAWENDDEVTSLDELIKKYRTKFFNFKYPFYADDELKKEFEELFLRQFSQREIFTSTTANFKRELQSYFMLNMDKWKRLFDNLNEDINPFFNYDVKTKRDIEEKEKNDKQNTRSDDKQIDYTNHATGNEKSDGVTNGTTHKDNQSFSRNTESDMPDDRLSLTLNEGTGVLDYASSITETTDKGTNDTTAKSDFKNNSDTMSDTKGNQKDVLQREDDEKKQREFEHDFTERKFGKVGVQSYTEMLKEYEENFETINAMIFKDLKKKHFFMGLY